MLARSPSARHPKSVSRRSSSPLKWNTKSPPQPLLLLCCLTINDFRRDARRERTVFGFEEGQKKKKTKNRYRGVRRRGYSKYTCVCVCANIHQLESLTVSKKYRRRGAIKFYYFHVCSVFECILGVKTNIIQSPTCTR